MKFKSSENAIRYIYEMTKAEFDEHNYRGRALPKFKATSNGWSNTIHGSKYFNVIASTDIGKQTKSIEIRFSNHDKSGNFITNDEAISAEKNYPDEYIQLSPDVYYAKGSLEVYSDKLNKNYAYIKKLIESNPNVQKDLQEYADMYMYERPVGEHKRLIMQAMKDGIKVDENVLKDYPDLLLVRALLRLCKTRRMSP